MARDPNKPTRMDGILNNIPKILEELTYPPESVDRRFSNATAKTLEPFYKPNLINDNRVPQPSFPLSILEGRGVQFVESDRTMAGPTLVGIGNQPLARPLDLNTGVDHIFYPGQPTTVNGPRGSSPIWASAPGVVNKFLKRAAELEKTTGQPTFLLPFEGGYKSNDWWTGTGKAMINYNLANAPDDALRMQEQILKDRIPNWPGSADPMAMTVWEATPGAVRMGITQELDQLKNVGGLSEGQARVATSRVESLNSPMGTIANIGLLDTQADYLLNKSPDYGATLMGKPIGVLDTPVTAFDFTREQTTATGQPLNIRALQMRDTSKVISPEEVSKVVTEADLRNLEDKGVDIDKGIKVKSPGVLGWIAGTVATIMGTGYSGQEVEAGVIDTAKKVVAADAKTTQRANTVNTAKSAAAYLKNQGASGKSLDYGAGHGINAKAMGFDETFEPFAGEGFTPTYTSGKDIPRGEYGQIVSTNVLNVIPPTDVIDGQMFRPRDMAVLNIGDALQDGGMAVIQTRSASAVNELKKSKTAIPQDESGAFVTSRGSYQKGFTRPELQEYVQGVLGDGFGVEIVPAKDISAGSAVKVVKLGRFDRANAQGFDMTPEGRLYHASKQDIPYMKPGYGDGLVFTTPDPEFANQWLGKGMYRHRDSGGSIDGLLDEKARFDKEANEKLNSLPESERDQYYQDVIWPKQRQLLIDIDNADSTVYPLVTRTKNPFRPDQDYEVLAELFGKKELDTPVSARPSESGGYDTLRDVLKDGSYVLYEDKKVVDFLKSKGYDSMFLKENAGKDNPFTTLAVFDGGDLRSPSAQFKDPSSRNLLAGGTSAAVGTGLLGASEESDASILGPLSKLGAGRQDLLGMAKKMANEGVDRNRHPYLSAYRLGAWG